MTKILPFRPRLPELQKLSMTTGQRDMILEYIEGQMLKMETFESTEILMNIHNLVFGFLQPVKGENQ